MTLIECTVCGTPDAGPHPPLGWTLYKTYRYFRPSTIEIDPVEHSNVYFCAKCHTTTIVRLTYDSR